MPENSSDMFGRFTDRARKVFALANQEAQRLNHEFVGTEHILLGLVKEGSGVGANVLKNLGVELEGVCLEVDKLVKKGPDVVVPGKLPETPLVQRPGPEPRLRRQPHRLHFAT